jgi:hypothetical protein
LIINTQHNKLYDVLHKDRIWIVGALAISMTLAFYLLKGLSQSEPSASPTLTETPVPTSQPKVSETIFPSKTAAAQTAATAKAQVTLPASEEPTRVEFRKLTEETWSQIPTIADLRALSPEELHHTPPVILQAGARLGQVAEALKAHPEVLKDAQGFYRDCARHPEFPTSIRALCYLDLTRNSPDTTEQDHADPQISDDVKRLADALGTK